MHSVSLVSAVLSLSATAFAACDYGTTFFPREPNVPVGTFGYTGLNGPLNWYGLNETANEHCAKGQNQSPINLNSSIAKIPGRDVKIHVDTYPNGSTFENLGTTLEVPANGTLVAGNKTYRLAQFHFHTPSEHRVNLEYFPMEMHFVFQAEDISMAVAAFVIDFGPADPLLASIFSYVRGIATPGHATLTGPLSFDMLKHHFMSNPIYQYSGSLTTPPCSEGVSWFISTVPLYIDAGTYGNMKSVLKFNSRFTQNTLGSTNLLQHAAEEISRS